MCASAPTYCVLCKPSLPNAYVKRKLLVQAAAVAEKTAAPAQTKSEYDLVTLTSFLLKVRHQPLLLPLQHRHLALET